MNILIGLGLAIAGLVLLLWLLFEWQYSTRQGNLLEFDSGIWQFLTYEPEHYQIELILTATNKTRNLDVFLVELKPEVSLLSSDSLDHVHSETQLRSRHANITSRHDNYWESYIVSPKKKHISRDPTKHYRQKSRPTQNCMGEDTLHNLWSRGA